MDETILPVDFQSAGQIVDDELLAATVDKLPNGAKMTAVMDCCHSGTGFDLPFTYDMGRRDWVEDDNPWHSEGDVVLFSGCTDQQTSADVQSMYQKPCGAMTEAFCKTLEQNPAPTYPQLLEGLHANLRAGGHSQRPMLTSSQRFSVAGGGWGGAETFQICDGIHPNSNATLGRHMRKRKQPKMDWLAQDDPLGDMLMGMALGDCLFGGGGGMFGGGGYGMMGGPFDGGYGMMDQGFGGGGLFGGGGGMMFGGGDGFGDGGFGDGGGGDFGGDFGGDGDF